ncbi:MAG: AMP-dependent synthetase, partial [Kocuria rhizophila]
MADVAVARRRHAERDEETEMTERTGQAHEAGTIDRLMAGWVADVETPDACAAHLLCDRWPADAVAFRFV